MNIVDINSALTPMVTFFSAMITSGVAVSLATQILKNEMLPIPAERYPRLTSAVISVVAVAVGVLSTGTDVVLTTAVDWVGFTVGVILTSAITYNMLLKRKGTDADK